AGQEAVGDPLRSRSPCGLSAMRSAADANGCGRRAATLRRLSKDHANDHAVTVEWTANGKHVRRRRAWGDAGRQGRPLQVLTGTPNKYPNKDPTRIMTT